MVLALCYAAFAAVWIIAIDLLVDALASGTVAHTTKGLLFVAGTAIALYALLRRQASQEADQRAQPHLADERTEDRIALARAHRSSEEMRLLSRRLLNAQEQERRDIARQLHDQLGQTLTVARLLVESTLEQIEDRDVSGMLQEAMKALESGLKETRTLTGILRPPMLDDLGLVPTLRWLMDRSTAGAGIEVTLDLPPDPGALESEVDVAAYRIAQEAIGNALQHGAPERLFIRLRVRSRVLTLTIEDDGCGFDPAQVLDGAVPFGRSGLLGIRERARALGGAVRIRSLPGQGTVVRAILPRRPRGPTA
ncbi:MAG: sensor histidine kinase [Gammaproteobacteria bacterium]|nr:MAG: sensor histidine kinase [Gammaproteobacteria bacterium]